MGWDGIYAKDRHYPIFEEGDEVYTESRYKAIETNKPYKVLRCFKANGLTNVTVIEIMTDFGYTSTYASYRFKKTESQLRDDKIKEILE